MSVYLLSSQKHTHLCQFLNLTMEKSCRKTSFALKRNRNVYLLHVVQGGSSDNLQSRINENKNTLSYLTDILFSNIVNYCWIRW